MDDMVSAEPPAPRGHIATLSSSLSAEDQASLIRAMRQLEHTNLATRLTSILGSKIGAVTQFVPAAITGPVDKAAEVAIRAALHIALRSLNKKPVSDRRRFHKTVAVMAGAAGGAFGIASLPVELPISTTIMLRSIADIARGEGEDLSDSQTALACLEVFALGGRNDDVHEARVAGDTILGSNYFAVRAILAKSVSEAVRFLAGRGLTDEAAPILVRVISQIAARFGLVVSQKIAAQSVPLIGAAGGAAINYAFVDHFQTIARGHFTIRRLERLYGAAIVQAEYQRLLQQA